MAAETAGNRAVSSARFSFEQMARIATAEAAA